MMKKRATPEELQAQIDGLIQEAEALQAKAQTEEGLTAEEQQKLDETLSQIEALQAELEASKAEVRFSKIKDKLNQPTRNAPAIANTKSRANTNTFGEGLRYWFLSNTPDADMSATAHMRTREAGFQIGSRSAKIPCDYSKLNFKNRTVLTKGGSGSGADYVYESYSDKVVEYLTYFSPIVGVVSSETTSDGNVRSYFRVNDTGMISTLLTASSGTESNPTIPETNIATGAVDIGCVDITSGYQKISFQSLRDSHAAVNLPDKIAKANSHSHARYLENEMINGSGNGSTGIQGLLAVDNALSSVSESSFGLDDLESLYFSVPMQYRQNACWLVNDATAKFIRQELKDTTGRSLFDKSVDQGIEFDLLLGKRFFISQYMPDDVILFFNPEFYQLRLVEGQIFQQFTEKFFPHSAWAGIMSCGGAWLGPTGSNGAVHSLTITS